MRARSAVILASLLLMTGGCRACTNAAKSATETPPPEVVETQTREALAKNPSRLTTICGVRVSGLENMKLTVVRNGLASSDVRVEGKPVFTDAGQDEDEGEDEDDAGLEDAGVTDAQAPLVVDKSKLLLCVGVVAIALSADLDREGHIKGWSTRSIEVDSVATPGVHFEKAKASAPRRRHHHHH